MVYSTPVVVAALSGEDVVVLTLLHRADGLTGVAVHPGARIQTAAQLRGHRVGVTPGTSSQLALDVLLAEGGLSPADVQVVEGSQTQLQALLARGEVDAASLWVPNLFIATRPDRANAGLVVSEIYSELSMLGGLRKHVEAHRTEFRRLLRALERAQTRVRDEPGLVFSTLRGRFPELTDENLRLIAGRSRFELGLSNLLLSSLRQEAAWLEERGLPRTSRVRLRDIPLLGPLDEVAPEAITLLTLREDAPAMKLARKLVGPQLVLLALLATLVATQLWVTRREQQDLETSTGRLQHAGLRIQRLGQLFSDTERDLLSVFVSRDETLVRRILSSNRELEQLLTQLEQGDWTPRGSSLVDDLRRMRPALTGAPGRAPGRGPLGEPRGAQGSLRPLVVPRPARQRPAGRPLGLQPQAGGPGAGRGAGEPAALRHLPGLPRGVLRPHRGRTDRLRGPRGSGSAGGADRRQSAGRGRRGRSPLQGPR